jgi:hypothetical protein
MAFYSIFKNSVRQDLKKIDILKLQPNDVCYYEKFKEPFIVSEVATTGRGVFYVEITHTKTKRTFVFTDFYPVMVASDIFQNRY